MANRKQSSGVHIGDLVVYEGQRMRVSGFPSDKMVILTVLVAVHGRPTMVTAMINDKKIQRITKVDSSKVEEEEE